MRGIKKFSLSSDLLVLLFSSGEHRLHYDVIADSLPEDARIVAVLHGDDAQSVCLLIASDTFPETSEPRNLTPALRMRPVCTCD